MSKYDELRKQCRSLESLFDTKISSYARLAANAEREDVEASGAPERWADLEEQLEDLLEKLTEVNDQLSVLLDDVENPPSQSMSWAIERHRSVLVNYRQDFNRTRSNVKTALERANLLSGVRNDIDAYKSSAAESLLHERGRIDSSHTMTDDILAQAYATREDVANQGASMRSINTRMAGVINMMPGVNNLLHMIKTRRRRDSIVLGVVIGLCLLFLVNYMLR